jgi:Peroxisome biogenesis factor 1, N-terminal
MGPFHVEIQPDQSSDWQIVESHATVEDAYVASLRMVRKRSAPAVRVVDAAGTQVIRWHASSASSRQVTLALLAAARGAWRSHRAP